MANDHRQALNGAEVFIRALENEGVKYIFAVPGEENLAFLEALRNSSIRLVLNRHEQAAGFMAATYGRFTGKARVADHDHRSRAGPEGLSPLKNSHTKAWVQT